MIKVGIQALGIDYERNPQKPCAPIIQTNLATKQGQDKFKDLDKEHNFDILHAAPPCGTASRAREKQLPAHLIKQGIPTPRQLRSNQYPLGLAGLTASEQLRVNLANDVYAFVLQECIDRHLAKRLFSLENPDTSYFWQVPLAVILLTLPGVRCVIFAQCLHGGSRPVIRRWVSNIPGMEELEGGCPGISPTHQHAAFGASVKQGQWKFATAEEATYPKILCCKLAKIAFAALSKIRKLGPLLPDLVLRSKTGLNNSAKYPQRPTENGVPIDMTQAHDDPVAKRLCVRAAGGKFVRGNRLPPIIAEFLCIENMIVPLSAKVGDTIPLTDQRKGKVLRLIGETPGELGFIKAAVGIYRTPKQFVDKAWDCSHPIDMPSSLPEVLLRNIFWLLTTSAEDVKVFRLNAIRILRQQAKDLNIQNDLIHQSLSPETEQVLQGKHFKLMEWAIQQSGYADTTVVRSIIEGTPLTGVVETSGVFPPRLIPASMDRSDLLKASPITRRPIIDNIRPSGDKEIDAAVWEETLLECEKGWLSKPMSELEIVAILGHEFTVARRFGLRQGGKIRAIDDYSEHGTNATVTTTERIDLLGTDELFLIMKHVAASVDDDGSVNIRMASGELLQGNLPPGVSASQARSWIGKTFDLKSAYRQLATSEAGDNRKFCVIGVYNHVENKTCLFIQYGAPFGSIASVYYFNRASRALWAVGAHALRLVWTNYFDDYPCLEPTGTASQCDIAVKSLFDILGWKLSSDAKKAQGFCLEFSVLGVVADLTQLSKGTAIYRNKPERVSDISNIIDRLIKEGRCPPPIMAEIRGKSQYASSQVFGRLAIGPLHVMSHHQHHSKSGVLDKVTITALQQIRQILNSSPPRMLTCLGEQRPLLLFTDGAAEGESRGNVTCGAVLIDTANDFSEMWGGRVPKALVKEWKADGNKVQVIGQAELLPIALARIHWRHLFRHRRLMIYVDNDSARQALVRGWSPSVSSLTIINDMIGAEIQDQCWIWYGRVPTHSNPADKPSRLILRPDEENDYARVIPMPAIPQSLFPSSR